MPCAGFFVHLQRFYKYGYFWAAWAKAHFGRPKNTRIDFRMTGEQNCLYLPVTVTIPSQYKLPSF